MTDTQKDASRLERLLELRTLAEIYGRRDSDEGPTWQLPSWEDVKWLLSLIDALDELSPDRETVS